LLGLLGLVLTTGLSVEALAVIAALRGPIIRALRRE
jgi:hypothetical protein